MLTEGIFNVIFQTYTQYLFNEIRSVLEQYWVVCHHAVHSVNFWKLGLVVGANVALVFLVAES